MAFLKKLKYFYGVNEVIHPIYLIVRKSKPTKSNQIKPNQTKSNQIKPNQINNMSLSNMSPSNQPLSIYIPRVFQNITKERIAGIFKSLDIGEVRQVDLVPRVNSVGEPYNMAFIHMRSWYASLTSANFQEKVLDPRSEARVVYDDPWYWIVLENRNPKSDAQLIVEQRLEVLEEAVGNLRMHCDRLEYENNFYQERLCEFLGDDDDFETPLQEPYAKEDGWHIVEDNEGTEFYVFDPNAEDLMPQRENADGGEPASPRLPAGFRRPLRSNAQEAFDYETALRAENDALAMTGALSSENNPNVVCEKAEIPPWMYNDDATLSWQEMHAEAEKFREEYTPETGTATEFVPRHSSECRPISLPLQEGQVEINPTDGSFNVYSNVNGDHIWTTIPEEILSPAVIAKARKQLGMNADVHKLITDNFVSLSSVALEVQNELESYAKSGSHN